MHLRSRPLLIVPAVCLAILAAPATAEQATTYTVTSAADAGPGTLRQAVIDANANAGTDTIRFQVGTGPETIALLTPLPDITGPVIIDGRTQPGFDGSPIIEISGAAVTAVGADGIPLRGGGSVVRGLVVNGFNQYQISMRLAGSNQIRGNYVGTDMTGSVALTNGYGGIGIFSTSNNIVGGTTPADRNVVAGHQHGVWMNGIGTNSNQIIGNYIGTDATGTVGLGNVQSGIQISTQSASNIIGGTAAGTGNVIAKGGTYGILIDQIGGTQILGNYIGTNAAGTAALGNEAGVLVNFSSSTIIGGTATGARNLISGNTYGVEINGSGANNVMYGNYIGTNAAGTAGVPNTVHGVWLLNGAGSTKIGGATAGQGNIIAFNGNDGVNVDSGTRHAIRANSIYANVDAGIKLGGGGVPPNDVGDGDTGANSLQNYPVLTGAVAGGGEISIEGTLNSDDARTYALEFFGNTACDGSGHGEGRTFLGTTSVVTDALGNAGFEVDYPGPSTAGVIITATATDSNGNTSEFSSCLVPLPRDTDGDALPDDDEVNDGTDPAVHNPDPLDLDDDGDGCADVREQQPGTASSGGDRDMLSRWDFFDVNDNQAVDLSDALVILGHFGHGPNDDAFDNGLDRYAPDPQKPWRTDEAPAALAGVDLGDALTNLQSFGHSCAP